MAIKFPSFEPGSPGTLLDSANAKLVKQFIEAWNNAVIQQGSENSIKVSDSNVLITLAESGGVPDGYAEEIFTICEDGAPVDVYLLVRRDE